jgi:hypothetical protein
MVKRDRIERNFPTQETGKNKKAKQRPKQHQDLQRDDIQTQTKSKLGFRRSPVPENREQFMDKRLKPEKPKVDMETQPESPLAKPDERFDKAFAISLGLIALLSLLLLIPFIGPFMGLTLVPYLACNRGCRYVSKVNGLQVGILVGAIWSIIEIFLMFQILDYVKISVSTPGIKTGLDLTIIIILFTANLIFCMLGGYTGGLKFEKLRSKNKIKEQVTHSM